MAPLSMRTKNGILPKQVNRKYLHFPLLVSMSNVNVNVVTTAALCALHLLASFYCYTPINVAVTYFFDFSCQSHCTHLMAL